MTPAAEPGRSLLAQRAVEELCQVALDARVELPPGYAERVCEEGLRLCDRLGTTRLGEGVLLHTSPEAANELPRLLGYAEPSGQWYGDGTRYGPEAPDVARPAAVREARS
jgi:hypothetical protein